MRQSSVKVWQYLKHIPVILALTWFGVFVHEIVGHALIALVFGARITQVNIIGLQLYPSFAWQFVPGYFGWVHWDGALNEAQAALVELSEISTLAVSMIAVLVLNLTRAQGIQRTALIVMSLYFLDALLHVLPLFGLSIPIFGQRSAASIGETYYKLMQLGIPGPLYLGIVIAASAFVIVMLVRAVRRDFEHE